MQYYNILKYAIIYILYIYIYVLQDIEGTINSKINGTPKGVYMSISKLHSILVAENLIARNNLLLCCYGQVNKFATALIDYSIEMDK